MSLLNIYSSPESVKKQKALTASFNRVVKGIAGLGLAPDSAKEIVGTLKRAYVAQMNTLRNEINLDADVLPADKKPVSNPPAEEKSTTKTKTAPTKAGATVKGGTKTKGGKEKDILG